MSLMPQPQRDPPTKETKVENVKAFTDLYHELQKIESQPNTFTLAQFREFEPLFRKEHKLDGSQIDELMKKYRRIVDFYKSTVIIKSASDPTVVVTLPPLLTPFRSLAPTKENDVLVVANTKMSGHQIPLYSSTAFGRMITALFAEQSNNKDVVEAQRKVYVEAMRGFAKAYGTGEKSPTGETTPEKGPDTSSTEWEFD